MMNESGVNVLSMKNPLAQYNGALMLIHRFALSSVSHRQWVANGLAFSTILYIVFYPFMCDEINRTVHQARGVALERLQCPLLR